MLDMLAKAGRVAMPRDFATEKRNFLHGCIGIREDGVEVSSQNGAVISSSFENYRIISDAHAEARCIKKMGRGGVLYVSRILKSTGELSMSSPCQGCRCQIKAAKIEKVFYSINSIQYGIWHVRKDYDIVFTI